MADALTFPEAEAGRLEPHLPPRGAAPITPAGLPFVTLTFATSMDSGLSLAPGVRTTLSGPQSKAMTHYLRSRHDAICIGVGTAIADNPGLNCRIAPATGTDGEPGPTPHQPRPIVIDPALRWKFTAESKVMQLARAGNGLAPYIITAVEEPPADMRQILESVGGKYIRVQRSGPTNRLDWEHILRAVMAEGLRSIMIEGGGEVINSLLAPQSTHLLDSVIVTLAPTWLGQGSVTVSPPRQTGADGNPLPAARLTDVTWIPLGEDIVVCGRILRPAPK